MTEPKIQKDLLLEKHVPFISTYGKTHDIYVSCNNQPNLRTNLILQKNISRNLKCPTTCV